MNIDRRWILLIAVTMSAAIGAAFAARTRSQRVKAAGESEHKTDLKAWENEGGNLAPPQVSTVQIGAHS
jgi:hypothetical protein